MPHRSMTATIDWSYDFLDSATRHVFDRLAVFTDEFDLEAAASVGGCDEVEPAGAVEHIARLVDASMLVAVPSVGGERYRMLELLRHYAMKRLADRRERDDARRAHADHYRSQSRLAGVGIDGPEAGSWWDTTISDRRNLRVAVEWSVAHDDPSTTLQFARVLARTWEQTVSVDSTATSRVFRAMLDGSERCPPDLRGWATLGLVMPSFLGGELDVALESSDRATHLFEESGDRAGTATTLWTLGTAVLLGVGDTSQASDLLRRAVAAASAADLPALESWATAQLAQSELFGEVDVATVEPLLDRSEALADDRLDMLQAHLAMNRSYLAFRLGDPIATVRAANVCRERGLAAGSVIYELTAHLGLGAAALTRHDPSEARICFLRAAQLSIDAANRLQLGIAVLGLAAVADTESEPVQAARLWGAGSAMCPVWPFIRTRWFPNAARRTLGDGFDAESAAGRALSTEQIVDLALDT